MAGGDQSLLRDYIALKPAQASQGSLDTTPSRAGIVAVIS